MFKKFRLMRKLLNLTLWLSIPAALTYLLFYLNAGLIAVCLYAFILILLAARVMAGFWLSPITCEREISGDVVRIGDHVNVIVKL